jgi:hypothetical protein
MEKRRDKNFIKRIPVRDITYPPKKFLESNYSELIEQKLAQNKLYKIEWL